MSCLRTRQHHAAGARDLTPPSIRALRGGATFLILGLIGLLASALPARGLEFPGPEPGPAKAYLRGDLIELGNRVIHVQWRRTHDRLRPVLLQNRITGESVPLENGEVFYLLLGDGQVINASQLKLAGAPLVTPLRPNARAATLAQRVPGQQTRAALASEDGNLEVEWRACLRDGGNTIQQEVEVRFRRGAAQLKELALVDLPTTDARLVGTVPGSPVAVGNQFFGLEHPDARNLLTPHTTCSLALNLPLLPGQSLRHSSVMGVVPAGQMRRGFLYYVERERAHPYRPFLHYNAWYDICWGDRKIAEHECLGAIEQFGRELTQKRGVKLASFVWDDGWDDPHLLWRPVQTNFPNGFTRILAAARRYDSTLGFWLSPFGGYGAAAQDRLALAQGQGFETNHQGFSLAGTNYYPRFRETCLDFVDHCGANFFKFDGLARAVAETEAMLRLTRALRTHKPDLFISITTGTWPSPFWLWYGDSTWRGGDDMGFCGHGPKREQWVTYRDAETYRRVVQAAPLYPLNSLMNQGFALARYGKAAEVGTDPEEVSHDLRSLFACGTCLQELYVTPGRMLAPHWDDLAECAKWGQARADVLVDTHWVGGDPGAGQVYGWAAWSKRRGVLALRNPSVFPASIAIDIAQAFELPARAPRRYTLRSPWLAERDQPVIDLEAGHEHTFRLEPFAVQVFDARPR